MTHTAGWIFLAVGIGGFAVCIISDFVGLRVKKFATVLFAAGIVMIAAATIAGLITYSDLPAMFRAASIIKGCEAAGVLFFAGLTVYSMVSVPKKNYKEIEGDLTDTGLYALCRHPGVWCLGGAYLFLGLMADSSFMWIMGVTASMMNVIYVMCQDIYIFPKTIDQYESYKTRVPFLFPNRRSIRRAFCDEKYFGGTE